MSNTDFIKNAIIKKKLKTVRPKRKPILRALSNFRNILVISEDQKKELIQPIGSHFNRATITTLYKRSEKEDNSEKGHYSAHLSDINAFGKIKNEKLIQLTNKQYDLIIDLLASDELLRYISQHIKSSFIIGKSGTKSTFLYDLIIEPGNTEKEFIANAVDQIIQLSANGKQ